MLVEAGCGVVAFCVEVAEGGAVFVCEVVVPRKGAAFDSGEVVGYEFLDAAAKYGDGPGGSVDRCYGVEGLAGCGEE